MKKVTIVIRALNEEKHLDKLFNGLAEQSYRDFEVVFVDSGSTDGSPEKAKSYNAKVIHIAKEDFSFGRALNIGCAHASGEIIVAISAHVYPVHQEWLENLVTPFLNNVKTGIVYGKQIGNEKTKFSEHQVFKKWFPSESINNQNSYFCNNANCATTMELWEKIKYDEELTGLEDLKYAKKVKQENYEICYRADAAIVHVHEENFNQTLNRYRREAIAMKEIEKEFSYGLLTFLKGIFISIFNDWWMAIQEEKFFKEFLNIVKFRYAQCYGTYKGFSSSKVIENEIYEKFYGYDINPSNKVEKGKLTKINYEK